MLTAPPVDGVEDEGGRERRELLLPATEESPPHLDSKGGEPWLCSRQLSLMLKLSWLHPTEVREAMEKGGLEGCLGEWGGADLKDMGRPSEP